MTSLPQRDYKFKLDDWQSGPSDVNNKFARPLMLNIAFVHVKDVK